MQIRILLAGFFREEAEVSDRSQLFVRQKRAHALRLARFRDNPVSELPTPFSMLFRLAATMTIAISIATAISYLAKAG
jgi:hypothetical protein